MDISRNIRSNILETLLKIDDLLGSYRGFGVVDFLNFIWPLRDMPSTDNRFRTAYDDAKQHMVNNGDWTLEYALTERFDLLEGEEAFFINFLETVVSPNIRPSKERIETYVTTINDFLSSSHLSLKVVDYFDKIPVYKIRSKTTESIPAGTYPNHLPFYVIKESDKKERSRPCFTLEYDQWDDFGYVTQFKLRHLTNEGGSLEIGQVKIMKKGATKTYPEIAHEFIQLPFDFCSLGQDEKYYLELKNHFPANYQNVLYALRDVAFYPRLREEFELDDVFVNSLTRDDDTEQLMRTIRMKMFGMDLNTCFKFAYEYHPPFSSQLLNINFDFEYASKIDHRIYAIIGQNGTGKTRLLSSIAKDLSNPESTNFAPRRPLYAKIFSVSYSFFDQHDIPEPDPSFNYVYCGLKKPNKEWLTNEELKERFFRSVNKILEKKLVQRWRLILRNFIPGDILDVLFQEGFDLYGNVILFNTEAFLTEQYKLSSGQSILIYILSEIVAQIRLDSLILYDEPETHLHPNAISSLINTLFSLVHEFSSFCIIGTHSPLIIQEIHARDVYILDRKDLVASVRTLGQESFGENLSIITDEIFGNREIPRHYVQQLRLMVEQGKSYEEIVGLLEPDDDIKLSLNAKLFIKSLIAQHHEKP
jgi:ABC-type lipoprotein export system ATPase subunit